MIANLRPYATLTSIFTNNGKIPKTSAWLPKDEDEAKLVLQKRELAQLKQEAETTRRLILEVRCEAEEATNVAAAATTRAAVLA